MRVLEFPADLSALGEYSNMSRMVSFAVLIAVLGVTAVLFYRVMAGFLLPLFLAALLVVMFRPMHQWILTKVRGRKRTAAGLTTSVIFLIVLAPMVLILWQASLESVALFDELQKTDFGDLRDVIDKVDDQLDFLELTDQRKEEIVEELGDSLTGFLQSMKEQGPAVAGKILGGLAVTLAGLAVMMISVYYFLVDPT
jgi:predicted PurR-regulated permease PerM